MSNFKIGDEVISTKRYSYIRLGTRLKIIGINQTGSLKFLGVSGNYDPANFKLADQPKSQPNINLYDQHYLPIVAGEYYVGRNGQKYYCEHVDRDVAKVRNGNGVAHYVFAETGWANREPSKSIPYEVVGRWIDQHVEKHGDSPIQSVTTSKLVPGYYGKISVNNKLQVTMLTTDNYQEIRDAAKMLNQIADFLEPKVK